MLNGVEWNIVRGMKQGGQTRLTYYIRPTMLNGVEWKCWNYIVRGLKQGGQTRLIY